MAPHNSLRSGAASEGNRPREQCNSAGAAGRRLFLPQGSSACRRSVQNMRIEEAMRTGSGTAAAPARKGTTRHAPANVVVLRPQRNVKSKRQRYRVRIRSQRTGDRQNGRECLLQWGEERPQGTVAQRWGEEREKTRRASAGSTTWHQQTRELRACRCWARQGNSNAGRTKPSKPTNSVKRHVNVGE